MIKIQQVRRRLFFFGEKQPLQIALSVRPPDIRDRSVPSARWSTSFVLGRTSEVKQNEQCVETHFFVHFIFNERLRKGGQNNL